MLVQPVSGFKGCRALLKIIIRPLSSSATRPQKQQPPRVVLNEADITENFLRGTGPGGQKINKTSCAVQLLHAPTGIVIKCQDSRARTVNRAIARKKLQDKIEEVMLGSESRTERKKAAESAKKKSKAKKARRKYRALDEGEEGEEGEEGDEKEGGDAVDVNAEPVDKVKQEFEKIVQELAQQKEAERVKKAQKQQGQKMNG